MTIPTNVAVDDSKNPAWLLNSTSDKGRTMAQYALKDIKPNPFRHIDHYPILDHKLASLLESIRKTTFWDNIVARANNGHAEIAYGHHRLAALRQEYGPNHKINLIIRELSDESMLQIMARENMEEWGTSAIVEQETIRATVEAFAEGKIKLPSVPKDTNLGYIRYAPSFISGVDRDAPPQQRRLAYTAQTVADFIGWLKPESGEAQTKVRDALTALQYIEEGLLTESDFEGLSTTQANAVIEEARKSRERRENQARLQEKEAAEAKRQAKAAEKESERQRANRWQKAAEARAAKLRAKARKMATTVGRAVSRSLKSGARGYKQARDIAAKIEDENREKAAPPDIERYATALARDIDRILDPQRDDRARRLQRLIKYRQYLAAETRKDLAKTLELIAQRFLDAAQHLRGDDGVIRRRLTS